MTLKMHGVMTMTVDTIAEIKACQGIYRASDVARKYGVHRSTVIKYWDGTRRSSVSPATDYPDWYSRPTTGGMAEEVSERISRGDNIKDIADELGISLRYAYQLRGVYA